MGVPETTPAGEEQEKAALRQQQRLSGKLTQVLKSIPLASELLPKAEAIQLQLQEQLRGYQSLDSRIAGVDAARTKKQEEIRMRTEQIADLQRQQQQAILKEEELRQTGEQLRAQRAAKDCSAVQAPAAHPDALPAMMAQVQELRQVVALLLPHAPEAVRAQIGAATAQPPITVQDSQPSASGPSGSFSQGPSGRSPDTGEPAPPKIPKCNQNGVPMAKAPSHGGPPPKHSSLAQGQGSAPATAIQPPPGARQGPRSRSPNPRLEQQNREDRMEEDGL